MSNLFFFNLLFLFFIKCNDVNPFQNETSNSPKIEVQCNKGFYPNDGSCFSCYENCLECDGIKCTECKEGYFPSQMNCNKCYPNCLKCDGIKCNQCLEGYYSNDMDCYQCYPNCIDCDGIICKKCTKGFYPVNMDCYSCYSNCLECNGIECTLCKEGYIPHKMNCFSIQKISCINAQGYYMLKEDFYKLKKDNDHNFICLNKEMLGEGYYLNYEIENGNISYFWDLCNERCLNCDDNKENNCTKCDEINYYKLYEEKNSFNNFKCYKPEERANYFLYEENAIKYLKKCSENCLTCLDESNNKCLSCNNENYFIKYEDLPKMSNGIGVQCYSQIELPNYYLYMNKYFRECIGECSTNDCDVSCTNCLLNNRYECLSCNTKKDFYLLANEYNETKGTFKCYLKNDYPHYFINETDKTLVECSNSCSTCITQPSYCLSCANDAYYAQGFNDNKCYFDKPEVNWVLNNDLKIWQKCHNKCNTCFKSTNSDNDQQCTSCNIFKKYFPYQKEIIAWNNGNNKYDKTGFNCYERNQVPENYFLDPNNLTWIKCSKSCSKCDLNPNNCLLCNKDNEYYNIKHHKNGTCFKNPLVGYILDSEDEFNKCFRTCKYCYSTSNSFFYMQCKECDEINYTLSKYSYEQSYCIPKDNSTSLYLKDQLKWYITGYNSSEHNKIYDYEVFNDIIYEKYDYNLTYKCPEDKPYIIYSIRQCVSSCSNPNDLFEYGLFYSNKSLYFYNDICYDECPMGSMPDNKTMTCIERNKYSFENLIIKEEFEKFYQQNVDIYLAKSANNTVFQIVSVEFTNFFYNSSTNDSWKYEQYMPLFDFNECISLLVETYNYSKDEIHIGIFQNNDLKKNNPNSVLLSAINSTSFKLFLSNGTNINFSICNNMEMKVEKPINTSLIWNFDESLDLLNKYNLSIFDINNEIFDDICVPLELNGKDLSIFTRQNRIKSKLNLCDQGCEFLGVDYEKNYSICKCKIKNEEEKQMDMKGFMAQNFDIINQTKNSNIKIFKCLTKTKFDRTNYIFYISLIFLSSNCFLLFFAFYLFYVKNKTNQINSSESKESVNNTFDENKNTNKKIFSYINNSNHNSSLDNNGGKNKTFVYNFQPEDEQNKNSETLNLNEKIWFKNKKNILSKSVPIISTKNNKEKEINKDNNNNDNNEISEILNNNFCFKFKKNLYNNFNEILPYKGKNNFDKISLLIMIQMVIFLLQSFLFWTGLLNTEEYLTKRFDEKNKIGFLYILTNEFNKYFITSLIIFVSFKILKYLYNETNYIKSEKSKNEENKNLIFKNKCIKIFIEVIIFIFHMFYMIFLYIFGNIYPNNKNLLLISALISLFFNIIIDVFIFFFASFLMTIPFICRSLNITEIFFKEIGEYLMKLI